MLDDECLVMNDDGRWVQRVVWPGGCFALQITYGMDEERPPPAGRQFFAPIEDEV